MFLPYELQKAMAAEAEGTRIAKAKVIEAEGEIKAAENLKEASNIMMENPNIMLVNSVFCSSMSLYNQLSLSRSTVGLSQFVLLRFY